jgi:pimeloyl-ACP methyl ester carboxylesterase
METRTSMDQDREIITFKKHRKKLLESLPISEQRIKLAGISTAVLIGGDGPPMILLHGPGETSLWWMRVIPILVKTHRVIVPDLPGHGESKVNSDEFKADFIFPWLSELIEQTCPSPPALVGNILGGSIGARFAIKHGDQLQRLILVNSLGLGKFRPAPRFAFGLFRFMIWPTEKNFNRFFPQCIYDVDGLRNSIAEKWDAFMAYNIECARDEERRTVMQAMMKKLGIPKIPSKELEKIKVPTALVWGRYDKANKLKIAKAANKNFGWPLYVIDDTRDDPKIERPKAFSHVLSTVLRDTSQ